MFSLLRDHPDFRRLWGAQVVSNFGDWLGRVAILVALGDALGPGAQAGIGLLFALEMVARLLPGAFFGPLAGSLADTLCRRRLMIGADLARALVVLGFLTLEGESDRPLLYALLVAQMGLSIFFEAARSAALPSTLPPGRLQDAYGLAAATWSVMLSVGAFVGGWIVATWGPRTAWSLDALSYVLSALLVARVTVTREEAPEGRFSWSGLLRGDDLRRAWSHLGERRLRGVVLTKTFWGMAGGFLVVLGLRGRWPLGPFSPAFATGALYAARGLGTALGPVLARRLFRRGARRLRAQILFGFAAGSTGYLAFSFMDTWLAALLAIVLAHSGGSALWVASTTWYQQGVADRFRGRVAVLEYGGMTLGSGTGALICGVTYDATLSLPLATRVAAGGVILGGLLWARATACSPAPTGDPVDER